MSHGCKGGSGLIVCFPFFLVGEQRGTGCRTPAAHGTLWELCDSPGRGRTIGVDQAAHLQLIRRLVRIAARTVVTSGVAHRYRVRIEDLR
jgi:hypothetical protein